MRRDPAYLLDVLLAARAAREFATALTWSQFEASRLHQYAVMKALETIGEAASRISAETRAAYPDLPWTHMIGMRHRLIHAYFDVDLRKVWDTVHDDLPPLIAALERIVPPDDG